MFTETLTLEDGLNWCLNTPLFRLSASQLSLSVEDLFSQTLEYLQNKQSLSLSDGKIKYLW